MCQRDTTWRLPGTRPVLIHAIIKTIQECNTLLRLCYSYCEPNGAQGESIVNTVFSILRITGLYPGVSGL
nr:MAG TPA: hypothetical protein [Caudoviricetes sp.]